MIDYEFLNKLTAWRKSRIENYASKKGVKYNEAMGLLMQLPTMKARIKAIDSVCDPEFHSTNQPTK